MVNVGLRAYLWNDQKDRQQRVSRELWLLNGATYHAFRQYTSHVKDNGFPEQRRNSVEDKALPRGRHPTLDTRLSLATQGSMARQGGARSFTFAGKCGVALRHPQLCPALTCLWCGAVILSEAKVGKPQAR